MASVQELEKPHIPSAAPEPKLESPADAEKIVEQQEALRGIVTSTAAQTTAQVVTDDTGQPILTSTDSVVPEIILPETEVEAQEGIKAPVEESRHWLAAWVLRMVEVAKKIGAKIVYKNKISN